MRIIKINRITEGYQQHPRQMGPIFLILGSFSAHFELTIH
jgi:hypothetical protein